MAMDAKELIGQLVTKIAENDELQKQFKTDPVKAVEKVLGMDLPDDLVEKVITGVKAKMTADNIADAAAFLKKLF